MIGQESKYLHQPHMSSNFDGKSSEPVDLSVIVLTASPFLPLPNYPLPPPCTSCCFGDPGPLPSAALGLNSPYVAFPSPTA